MHVYNEREAQHVNQAHKLELVAELRIDVISGTQCIHGSRRSTHRLPNRRAKVREEREPPFQLGSLRGSSDPRRLGRRERLGTACRRLVPVGLRIQWIAEYVDIGSPHPVYGQAATSRHSAGGTGAWILSWLCWEARIGITVGTGTAY